MASKAVSITRAVAFADKGNYILSKWMSSCHDWQHLFPKQKEAVKLNEKILNSNNRDLQNYMRADPDWQNYWK